ncbi:hypothetical protein GCM10017772_11370 [Promicromonospora soli]|uniref:Uncharacterized protein n=1 Tax=Promicromonospora soli TaxID=2035533 RepID=A0A919FM87_9MICO|nr:hypothetical protein GCM10017772_11370 [Promicromonospora soli]
MSSVPKLVESMSASTASAPNSVAPVSSLEKMSMPPSLVQTLCVRIGRTAETAYILRMTRAAPPRAEMVACPARPT